MSNKITFEEWKKVTEVSRRGNTLDGDMLSVWKYQQKQIDDLQKKHDLEKEETKSIVNVNRKISRTKLNKTKEKLEDENERLKEVLGFYADEENWDVDKHKSMYTLPFMLEEKEGGEKARNLIEQLKSEELWEKEKEQRLYEKNFK